MIQISELLAQVVEKPDEEHNPLKNWREKMAGQPLPEDPAKKNRDLKVPQIWTLSVLLTGEFIWHVLSISVNDHPVQVFTVPALATSRS